MWRIIAEGTSLDTLHSTGVIDKLPHNTPFTIEITVKWEPIAKLADLAGDEWAAQQFLNVGAKIEDVEEKEGKVLIHCRANAVHLLPLLGVIAAIFAAVAFFIVAIKISAPVAGAISIGIVIAIIATIVIVGLLLYRGILKPPLAVRGGV